MSVDAPGMRRRDVMQGCIDVPGCRCTGCPMASADRNLPVSLGPRPGRLRVSEADDVEVRDPGGVAGVVELEADALPDPELPEP
jgi:hypothetical protein